MPTGAPFPESPSLDADLAAIAALSTTAYGRALLELADAAAGRTALELGTAATHAHGDYDLAGAAAAAQAASQPVDSDLTAIAALSTTAYGRALLALADAAAARTALALGTAATADLDADGALSANSASRVAAQSAVVTYVGTQVGTRVPASLVDAKGDLIVATADNAVARKAVGSDGFTLVANSNSSDGLGWAQHFPSVGVGDYLTTPATAEGNSGFGATGRIHAVLILVPKRMSFDRIGINLTAVATSGNGTARLGIYADDGNGKPGALVLDASTVSILSTTGGKETTISLTLDPGIYWAVAQGDYTGGSPAATGPANAHAWLHWRTSLTGGNNCGWFYTGAAGALPDPFPTPTGGINTPVGPRLRRA